MGRTAKSGKRPLLEQRPRARSEGELVAPDSPSGSSITPLSSRSLWRGNHRVLCGGRVLMAKKLGVFRLMIVVVVGQMATFYAGVVTSARASHQALLLPSVTICFSLWVWALIKASTTEPGLIPRAEEGVEEAPPDDGIDRVFCEICQIYRPPRTRHCAFCDSCVQRWDHHCPWLANCIGLRNYRYFVTFLSAAAVLNAVLLAGCLIVLVDAASAAAAAAKLSAVASFATALTDLPLLVVAATLAVVQIIIVLPMLLLNLSLIAKGITAYEYRRGIALHGNDEGLCVNLSKACCSPMPASLVLPIRYK
eukprot:PLAT316.1.p1 GENE.PLAT316.1~~PLAT316.1.p1  ORF type:complete len:308 (+),score=52.24 PLAT316.1:216-1139(+)